jgi:uncharacterized protein YciI
LVRLTYRAGVIVECFWIKARQAGAGQSGAGPPHSKELTLPLNQSFLTIIKSGNMDRHECRTKIMKKLLTIAALALLVFSLSRAKAQDKKEPQFKLIEFQMALLKRGPKWTGENNNQTKELESAQNAYAKSLLESGKAVIAGRLDDDGDIRGVYILRSKSGAEAKEWAENSPVVRSSHIVAEMHPWWSEDVMKKTATPEKFTRAYLGFLYRGDKWTPEKTPATEELQRAHLANIVRLAEMKKLVVAGPFGDDTALRGIFVFRVASIDEARELAATDPAVQAGRLKIDMHPWLVPNGILP